MLQAVAPVLPAARVELLVPVLARLKVLQVVLVASSTTTLWSGDCPMMHDHIATWLLQRIASLTVNDRGTDVRGAQISNC